MLFLIDKPEASATRCSFFSQVVTQRTLAPKDLGTAREQAPSFMPSEGAWLKTPYSSAEILLQEERSLNVINYCETDSSYCSGRDIHSADYFSFLKTLHFSLLCVSHCNTFNTEY